MTAASVKLRFVVEGRETALVSHPIGMTLPTLGDQVMAGFNGETRTVTIASQPQYEYDGHGEDMQRLVFVNYFVK